MSTLSITNPATNKTIGVRVFAVETAAAVRMLNTEGVKALSWSLLSQKHSVDAMERSEGGDTACNNFALSIFENALDWSLGLAVRNFITDARAVKRCPKAFKVGVSRKGDVFALIPQKSGGFRAVKY
jgi:hypothetical protein